MLQMAQVLKDEGGGTVRVLLNGKMLRLWA